MHAALAEAPGEQQLVIGETAGLLKSTKLVTSVGEFIAGLPQDVVCASTVYTQHAYIGGDDPVEPAAARARRARLPGAAHALDHRDRRRRRRREEFSAARRDPDAAGCRALHDRLVQWWNDPRVTVAFQYTVREDDKFPTGLFCTDLAVDPPGARRVDRLGRGARTDRARRPASACGT